MRGIVLQFLILFSVLCAGLHAPAAAHGDHGQATVLVADAHHAAAHEDFSDDSSSDPSQELYHHHHCPAALMVECGHNTYRPHASRDMLRPGEVTALVSRASAPPVEPPLA
jgi:beta-glucosidase/6-phospho-beta-glucosidase/beta-galactosidase